MSRLQFLPSLSKEVRNAFGKNRCFVRLSKHALALGKLATVSGIPVDDKSIVGAMVLQNCSNFYLDLIIHFTTSYI
uniref:Ribosomal_L7Ae domain-containing protein n=1 Tax=Loa loa TaxID=7209 RepID=A0A1I7V664_LOALO